MTTNAELQIEKPSGEREPAGADDLLPAAQSARTAPLTAGNRAFGHALLVAVLLHAIMFVPLIGLSGNPTLQRRMGEAFGDANAINVDVIEPQALPGAGEQPPSPPPAEEPPPVVAEPPLTPPPPEQPVKESATEPVKQPPPQKTAAAPPLAEKQHAPPADIRGTTDPTGPVADKPAAPPEPAPEQKSQKQADLAKELTEMFAPEPPRKGPPQPKQPQQRPDDDRPRVLDRPPQFAPGSSSFSRPVDITRSGENDEFGRGVIRALRQTMPVPWGVKARVTIMFYLTPGGQVAEMRLVQGSGYPLVDQSVVFAAGNAPFPRPPPGSKINDRIFLVTYIYE